MDLYKVDVDSAFRRIPIWPDHRKYASVILSVDGSTLTSTHLSMMFGSTASVHAWHRVASLIKAVARRILHLPVLCFVDDYFAVDLLGAAQSSMHCLVRLIRACLGQNAVSQRKVESGNPLIVLGVEIQVLPIL